MEIKKAIEEMNAAYSKALNQGDAEGCASVFLEDAVMMPPNQPMVSGKKAIKEFFQAFLGGVDGTHTSAVVDYGVNGQLAYSVGTYAMTGTKSPEQGKFVEVLRRHEEGTWKIAVVIYNTDNP